MAKSSHGTKLKRGDGATPTEGFTDVGGVLDISGPELDADEIETTAHDSTSEEFIMGVLRSGNVTFDINYDPADTQHKGLISDRAAKTLRNFKLVFPDTSEIAFSAYVKGFKPNAPVNGKLTASVTLRVSGAVTMPTA